MNFKRKCESDDQGIFYGAGGTSSEQNRKCVYGIDDYRKYFSSFNAFDRHKILINQYILYHPGTVSLLKRDESRDKRDIDIIRENHKFIWEENAPVESWGRKIAKKYYDKLFKEYCICDLSRYKTGQVGMRWRTDKEVVAGKGQFVCGERHCEEKENLRTWEMNFGYIEEGTKKNALVKLRLCHDCSYKVNYKQKRKELRKQKSKKRSHEDKKIKTEDEEEENVEDKEKEENENEYKEEENTNIWKEPAKVHEEKGREEEFEEYLQDLFL